MHVQQIVCILCFLSPFVYYLDYLEVSSSQRRLTRDDTPQVTVSSQSGALPSLPPCPLLNVRDFFYIIWWKWHMLGFKWYMFLEVPICMCHNILFLFDKNDWPRARLWMTCSWRRPCACATSSAWTFVLCPPTAGTPSVRHKRGLLKQKIHLQFIIVYDKKIWTAQHDSLTRWPGKVLTFVLCLPMAGTPFSRLTETKD